MKGTGGKYHHGDLRQAVLDLARKTLETKGIEAVSLRSLSAELGVTHRALYNHFSNKNDLLSAIAAIGYRELADLLRQAKTAQAHLQCYATFALDHYPLYTVMMNRSNEQFEKVPELRTGADAVISASLAVLAPGEGSETEKRRSVMRQWMLVHGGVGLHRSGTLRDRTDTAFITELALIAGYAPETEDPS